MDIIVFSLVLIGMTLALLYRLSSNDTEATSMPYVKRDRYPVVGHLLSFFGNRAKFMMECYQCNDTANVSQSDYLVNALHLCFPRPTGRPSFEINQSSFLAVNFRVKYSVWIIIFSVSSYLLIEYSRIIIHQYIAGNSELDMVLHRFYIQYLKNSDGLSPMIAEFIRRIHDKMMREKAALENRHVQSQWQTSGLCEFSHRMVFEPTSLALFGEIDPLSLESDYRLFDSKIQYFFALFPSWFYSLFFRSALQARSRLNSSWVRNPHPAHESDFIRARTTFILDHPEWFSKKDYCCEQTALLWGSLSNTIPAVFWCFLYVLRDTKAVEAIKQEIDKHLPAFSLADNANNSLIEQWTLDRLKLCICLDSAVNETIRLVGSPMVLRKCVQETQVVLKNGRTLNLKPNDGVAMFPTIAHLDPNIFPDPTKFVFDRFIERNADTVPGFLPFEAGRCICPGRYLARYIMKISLAFVSRYVEYKFVDTETIPTQDPRRVGVGVPPPQQDITFMYRYKI